MRQDPSSKRQSTNQGYAAITDMLKMSWVLIGVRHSSNTLQTHGICIALHVLNRSYTECHQSDKCVEGPSCDCKAEVSYVTVTCVARRNARWNPITGLGMTKPENRLISKYRLLDTTAAISRLGVIATHITPAAPEANFFHLKCTDDAPVRASIDGYMAGKIITKVLQACPCIAGQVGHSQEYSRAILLDGTSRAQL